MSPPASNARPPSPAGETRSLLRLGLPIIVGLAASALMGVVDSAVLGNATASALAAVSLTSSVALVFIADDRICRRAHRGEPCLQPYQSGCRFRIVVAQALQ